MTPKQKIALSIIAQDRLRIEAGRLMFRTDAGHLAPCRAVTPQIFRTVCRLDWVAIVDGRPVLTPLGQDELQHGRLVTQGDHNRARRYRLAAAEKREALR